MGPATAAVAPQLEVIAQRDPQRDALPLTDQGNAERLTAEHGHDLRYVSGIGWHAFDGRRWRRDTDGEPIRRAKAVARGMLTEAGGIDDDRERKAHVAHALRSESEQKLRAAVTLASTEAGIVAQAHELDADTLLFNVENGTLDLRTGRLREHRRADLLTKLAPAAYHGDATSPTWARFLHDLTGGDHDQERFLQRAVGYTLTGNTDEEVLFFAHGPAATGKSTFLEALKGTLGDYGTTADFDAFLARRGDGGVRSDIARLAGARLVIGVEVDDGKRLAEGLLKQLTGGDTVTARFMYRDYFEYRPQFKLWLAANHRPRVSAEDEAIWRRIVQIPFRHVVPAAERDPALKRELTTDPAARAAILSWALEGCLAWQRNGLAVPAVVRDYTAEYRAENDPLGDWLASHCHFEATAVTSAGALRESYTTWAEANGERPVSAKAIAAALSARGCQLARQARIRTWRGIALRSDG